MFKNCQGPSVGLEPRAYHAGMLTTRPPPFLAQETLKSIYKFGTTSRFLLLECRYPEYLSDCATEEI